MKTGIYIKTKFFPLAFFLFFVTPCIEIDGKQYRRKWGRSFFEIPAGQHNIKVFFPYIFMRECGANQITLSIEDGEEKHILYKAPLILFFKGKIKIKF